MRPLAVVAGASSGVGLSMTKVLGEHGYEVVALAEDAEVHHSPEVHASPGSGVVPVQADLATASGVGTLHHRLTMMDRPVAVAALNADVSVGGAFDQTALDDDLRLVDLNCRSVVQGAIQRDVRGVEGVRTLLRQRHPARAAGHGREPHGAAARSDRHRDLRAR